MENLRGIAMMILSMAAFAVEDAFIKFAAVEIPTGQILIFLGTTGGLFFAALCRARGIPILTATALHPAMLMRNAGDMIGALCFVTALSLTPLTSVSAILQATPLVVTMGAALFLGEAVGWRRWSAIGAGFLGVLIVVRPGFEAFQPASLFTVCAVFALAARDVATRKVPPGTPSLLMAVYGFVSLIPAGILLLGVSGGAVWPSPVAWAFLCSAATVGLLAYYTIILATRLGDVSVVTPFRYSRLIFALILGTTFFGERPDLATLSGAALIIASGLYTFLRERRVARTPA